MEVMWRSPPCASLLLLNGMLFVLGFPVVLTNNRFHPVIFVPGYGGSQLRARIDEKLSSPFPLCDKNSPEYPIWLSILSSIQMTEFAEDNIGKCFVDNMKLVYNKKSRTTSDVQGVSLRVPGFGDPYVVEWLHPDTLLFQFLRIFNVTNEHVDAFEYFYPIGKALVDLGLKRNINIRGAPYDFRKAPNEHEEYFQKLKRLIKKTFKINRNTPIVLIAHSMGGPMILHFLRRQKQEWKDKFIKSLITLSASWGGTVKAMKMYWEGDNLGFSSVSAEIIKNITVTTPSMAWMTPSRRFWGEDEVLVSTPWRSYTVNDMKDFFHDMGQPLAWEMYKDTLKYTYDTSPPGVEVHCLYGTDNETLEQMHYEGGFIRYVFGDGDGTVNLRSLEGCTLWSGLSEKKVYSKKFPKADHKKILSNSEVIKYIKSVVAGKL